MTKFLIYNNSFGDKQTKTTKSNIVIGIDVDMKTIAIVITVDRDLRPKKRLPLYYSTLLRPANSNLKVTINNICTNPAKRSPKETPFLLGG